MDNKMKQKRERPNIIWIFGDQHRAQALGCNGDPNVKTPNFDMMAENGINFINAVAGFPLCCPFRGSLLTGEYPHKVVPGHQYQMPPDSHTIAHSFNEAGYDTAYFGKWHVDGFREEKGRSAFHIVPPERRGGFKTWVGYENNNMQWDSWVHGGEGETAFHKKLDGYETDCLTDYLLEYLKNQKETQEKSEDENPFFAVLSYQPPHNPYFAPEENMDRYHKDEFLTQPIDLELRKNVPDIPRIKQSALKELAGYYAIIENMDWNMGRVIDFLKESGLVENTYIMFFSDHGDMHGSHGHQRKTSPYEESLRIPFIVWGGPTEKDPKVKGKKIPTLMNHVDIPVTSLHLAGVEVPNSMKGFDYSPYITKGPETIENEPDSAYLQSVIATGHHDCVDDPWRGVLTKDGWKYVCFNNADYMMFNLNEDPYEFHNMAHYGGFRKKKEELKEILREWVKKTGDKFNVPSNWNHHGYAAFDLD